MKGTAMSIQDFPRKDLWLAQWALVGLTLVMVACGGSRTDGSNSLIMDNWGPMAPTVVGPATGTALHPLSFQFSAIDPEGDPVAFMVNGTPLAGNAYTLTPGNAGSVTLSVVAKDSLHGGMSSPTLHTLNVRPNHPPAFANPDQVAFVGLVPAFSKPLALTATDEDGDGVHFALIGNAAITDNLGRSVPGAAAVLDDSPASPRITFSGAVPAGAASVRAVLQVRASDVLPGTTTLVGSGSTQNLTLTYTVIP
jgi:hypothetical protein